MKKILIVDDDKNFLELMKILLIKTFEITTASTAKDALELIDKNYFDGIILDISLPDYTGYYVAKIIRTTKPNLPIAFLTNYNGEVTKENAKEVNAKFWFKPDMVANPFNVEQTILELVS